MDVEGLPICEFAFPGPLRDQLVAAVLSGVKTATTCLEAEYLLDDEPLPPAGRRFVVVDSDEQPVAIIELESATVIRMGDADLRLAVDEGEGFESVEDWRLAHLRFWNEELRPTMPDDPVWPLTDDTRIVVERFRLIERLA